MRIITDNEELEYKAQFKEKSGAYILVSEHF